ncbi:MAG: OB-fold domain-containing protein [Pseudomonadota bacterium]|nr:OB-fold domain-containing protein [Pseudomonadota bacterium]
MPKQGVAPDELTAPFWAAANEHRLVIQQCCVCERLQHPPANKCGGCRSDDLTWTEMSGKGHIYNYGVVHDGPVRMLHEDQPFNVAIITLDDDPDIQMLSHLPGTPPDEVPVKGAVEVIFEETANGQKVPEWRVIG